MFRISGCLTMVVLTVVIVAQEQAQGREIVGTLEEVPAAAADSALDDRGRLGNGSLPPGAVQTEPAVDEGTDLVLRTPNDNTERMRFTPPGYVGIGTAGSAPDRPLVLKWTTTANYLKMLGSGTNDVAGWWTDGTNLVFAATCVVPPAFQARSRCGRAGRPA